MPMIMTTTLVFNALDPSSPGWVKGILNFDGNNPDNTNRLYLTEPQYAKLAPYTAKTAGIYKCPADKSKVKIARRGFPARAQFVHESSDELAGRLVEWVSWARLYSGRQQIQHFPKALGHRSHGTFKGLCAD